MSEKDISAYIKRYEEAVRSGKNIYLDADEFSDIAEYYDSIDDLEAAEDAIDRGLKIHPDSFLLIIKKAKFAAYNGQYEDALYLLDSTSDYDFDLYLLKIECYLQLGYTEKADDLAQKLIENESEEPKENIYAEIGFLYIEADLYKEAIRYFSESLKYDKENIDVLSDISYAYEMLGDFDEAIATTNKILDIESYTYEAWINLGKLYTLKDELEKAIDAFDFALTINDSDKNVHKLKAHCLSLTGRLDEAIDIFHNLLKEDIHDTSLYVLLADAYQSAEMYDEALLVLEDFISVMGETTELLSKKADLLFEKGDKELATKLITKSLKEYPNSLILKLTAGEIAFQSDDYEKAKEYFMEVYDKGEDININVLDRLGQINISQENYQDAIFFTEQLKEYEPDNHAVKQRLTLLYFEVDNKLKFNDMLDELTDKELSDLFKLFYEPSVPDYFDRKMLIVYLNNARETRTLFKNLRY